MCTQFPQESVPADGLLGGTGSRAVVEPAFAVALVAAAVAFVLVGLVLVLVAVAKVLLALETRRVCAAPVPLGTRTAATGRRGRLPPAPPPLAADSGGWEGGCGTSGGGGCCCAIDAAGIGGEAVTVIEMGRSGDGGAGISEMGVSCANGAGAVRAFAVEVKVEEEVVVVEVIVGRETVEVAVDAVTRQ